MEKVTRPRNQGGKIKLCRPSTVAYYMVSQLKAQVEFMRDSGFDVVLVSSDGPELAELNLGNGLSHTTIEIPRNLRPWQDLLAFFSLLRLFKQHNFDIVHSTTPKAGLLSAFAASIARVPLRLHTFTGQQWVTLKGPLRILSRLADKIIGILNSHCYADSKSQADFLIEEGIIRPDKISVIGSGSLGGVDLTRFNPDLVPEEKKQHLKNSLAISDTTRIIIYIGRITRDKGINELLAAFKELKAQNHDVALLLLGPLDQECGGKSSITLTAIEKIPSVHFLGYVTNPEKYLAISDLLCLPSYREGFGTVVIEAAAMGVPTLGTRINGLIDAVEDGKTGLLIPPRDQRALLAALLKLLDTPDLLARMGKAARQRCRELFDANIINQQVVEEYLRLLTLKKKNLKSCAESPE